MKKAWNYYLAAFKNTFDYKSCANRSELNWFLLFMFSFWMLIGLLLIGTSTILVILGKETIVPLTITILFSFAMIYLTCHAIPLISLIKRRFNYITPTKPEIYFGIWASIWFIQLIICSSMFLLTLKFANNLNPLLFIPLGLIGQTCGLLVIGTIIFLMIKEKPLHKNKESL